MIAEAIDPREFLLTPQPVRSLNVLVVDDEFLIRWSVAETLTERGYSVVDCRDARETLEAIRDASVDFDVVVLDYRLPDSDGLSLLESVRERLPEARVILMSAFGTPEVFGKALDFGAFGVLNKPFEMRALGDLVAEAGAAGLEW